MSKRIKVADMCAMGLTPTPRCYLFNVPVDVFNEIISYLNYSDICCLRKVCKYIRDAVDQSHFWQIKCYEIQQVYHESSPMWDLLQLRKVKRIDCSTIEHDVVKIKTTLSMLYSLTEIRVHRPTLLYFGELLLGSKLNNIKTLCFTETMANMSRIANHSTLSPYSWLMIVSQTMPNLTKLVLVSLHLDVFCILKDMPTMNNLKVLSVEAPSPCVGPITSKLAAFLFSQPQLQELKLGPLALFSPTDLSPFNPKACPEEMAIPANRRLKLKTLKLENAFIKTSDLQYLPKLTHLEFSVGHRSEVHELNELAMESWNTNGICPLRHLHITFNQGAVNSIESISKLKGLPSTVHCISLSGHVLGVSHTIASIGVSLGNTLGELTLDTHKPLRDIQLSLLTRTFRKLTYLTASVHKEVRPQSITFLENIPSFFCLRLTAALPKSTVEKAHSLMERGFMIILL